MRSLELFVVEDTPADLEWLKHVLNDVPIPFHMTVATDGEQAKQLLMHEGAYKNTPDPDLILLDMKMPKLDGPQVLREVPHSEEMPICIVSGTERKFVEGQLPYELPFSYLMKPIDADKLLACLRSNYHLKAISQERGQLLFLTAFALMAPLVAG